MAKRPRRPRRPRKDNVGCVWGLISLLDFRRGHPIQKLLSDTNHENTKHTGKNFSFMCTIAIDFWVTKNSLSYILH